MRLGTPLYDRLITYDYGDDERRDLMEKVWSVTPYVVNVMTGNINGDDWRAMMQWCREAFGAEAWPIHGREGKWQTGGATIFGETHIGFATSEDLATFQAKFGDKIIERARPESEVKG